VVGFGCFGRDGDAELYGKMCGIAVKLWGLKVGVEGVDIALLLCALDVNCRRGCE
jgi:hypothetical protein